MVQPKKPLKVPIPESSIIHDKVIPIPDYAIPQTRSRDDSGSRMVKEKPYRILVGKFQYIQIPFIDPLLNQ